MKEGFEKYYQEKSKDQPAHKLLAQGEEDEEEGKKGSKGKKGKKKYLIEDLPDSVIKVD